MQFVSNGPGVLKPWQVAYVQTGIKATNKSVPMINTTSEITFLVNQDQVPVGMLSLMHISDTSVEVGARFWERVPTAAFILSDWIEDLLRRYDAVVARCYASNRRVKRLLQRGGFRLVIIKGKIEFYAVSKDTFLGRRKETGSSG